MDRPASRRGDAEADAASSQPTPFLIQDVPAECRECWGCVRYCPADALRVAEGRSQVVVERCVKCGRCVNDCGNCGHSVRDDTKRVLDLLAGDRPVVAVLATEFVAALHPMSPDEIERALEAVGFYAVETTLLGEEMVALEYEQLMGRRSSLMVLRSTCPVTNAWVQRYHPSLVAALAPVVPPYVAQARLVKSLYPEGTAVVYVSPCYARKDEAYDAQFDGAVDAAIDFRELAGLVSQPRPRLVGQPVMPPGARRPHPKKEISLTDGFPRRVIADRDMTDAEVTVVRGLETVDGLLRAVASGEAAPHVVDMLSCDGCADGPAVNPGMSVYAKRGVVTAERSAHEFSAVSSRALLSHLPQIDLRRSFTPEPVIVPLPTEREIDEELARGEFFSREEAIDCGACGYRTCVEHAVAIVRGNSSWEMCFPLQRKVLSRSVQELTESATIDPLTDLWNRRAFGQRLEEEVKRALRYGTKLSLLMLDLDGFKAVNDGLGHVAGDAVLSQAAGLFREAVRVTDVPARYGGDEFAVILPGIGKTEAFVVAERLRQAVREHAFTVPDDGARREVRLSASIGVATAWPGIGEAVELLDAADRALYVAKESGKDQVRLAPG